MGVRRGPDEIDVATVMRMATAHLARFSASSAGLRTVLSRKIRRRCERAGAERLEDSAVSALLDEVVGKLTRAGLLDDAAFARDRMRRLAHKGLPPTRIRLDLQARGLPIEDGHEALEVDEETQARRFAARKRLGPFRTGSRTLHREKDIRALVRAGFTPRLAKSVVDESAADADA